MNIAKFLGAIVFYRTPSVTASGKQELMENMVCIIGNMGGIEIPCILFLCAFWAHKRHEKKVTNMKEI